MRISAFATRMFDFAFARCTLISLRRSLIIDGSFESELPTASDGASGIRAGETAPGSLQATVAATIRRLPVRSRLGVCIGFPFLDRVIRGVLGVRNVAREAGS